MNSGQSSCLCLTSPGICGYVPHTQPEECFERFPPFSSLHPGYSVQCHQNPGLSLISLSCLDATALREQDWFNGGFCMWQRKRSSLLSGQGAHQLLSLCNLSVGDGTPPLTRCLMLGSLTFCRVHYPLSACVLSCTGNTSLYLCSLVWRSNESKNSTGRASEMTQGIKVPANPRTHVVNKRTDSHKLSSALHIHTVAHTRTITDTHVKLN